MLFLHPPKGGPSLGDLVDMKLIDWVWIAITEILIFGGVAAILAMII